MRSCGRYFRRLTVQSPAIPLLFLFYKMTTNHSIPSLDGIRAVAVSTVFLGHMGLAHIIPPGFGVTVFFVLSGFLITTLFTQEIDRNGSINILAFFKRRLFRLCPPLFVTLLIVYGLLYFGKVAGSFDLSVLASQAFYYHNYFLAHAEPGGSVEGLAILWSLAVEEHFYLIFPFVFTFILVPFRKRGLLILSAMLLGLVLWRATRFFYFESSEWAIYASTDTRIDLILYGSLLAFANWQGITQRLFALTMKRLILSLAVGGFLLALSVLYRDDTFRQTIKFSLQGLALIPFFYYATKMPDITIFRCLNSRVLKRIGVYSYSIYLIHYVVFHSLVAAEFSPDNLLILSGLTMVISVSYAALMHELVEKPAVRLSRNLRFFRSKSVIRCE